MKTSQLNYSPIKQWKYKGIASNNTQYRTSRVGGTANANLGNKCLITLKH